MALQQLDGNQLYLLQWLFCFEEDPMPSIFWQDVWMHSLPDVSQEKAVESQAALVACGLAEVVTDEDGGEALALSSAARALQVEIFAPLRTAPLRELTLFEICCLEETLSASGYLQDKSEFADAWLHLADHPGEEFHRLLDEGLVLEYAGETRMVGCTPSSWAHRDEVRRRFVEAQPRLRESLAAHFVRDLELEPESPLARAWARIDRAHFVPEEQRLRAYESAPVPILEDMTTSQPNVVGNICKAVELQPGDRVLICGAKSGDLAALAADLVGADGHVIVLDSRQDVCDYAQQRIEALPSVRKRIEVHCVEDVTLGDEARGPWDAVVVNGALAKIPQDILTQTSDRGRLLFFMHSLDHNSQRCFVVRKNQDVLMPEIGSFYFTPIFGRWGWDRPEDLAEAYRAAREAREERGPAARIDNELPYPLAVAFASAWNAVDPGERHTRALKAYEALLKYLAIPLVALSCLDERKDPSFRRQLHALAGRPSLGHWLATLRDLSRSSTGHDGLADLRAPLTDAKALRALDTLHELVPRMQPYKRPGSLLDLFNVVVAYRNRSGEGHGGARGAADLEQAADLLLGGLAAVLIGTTWLREHRLLHLSQLTIARGGVRVRILDFRGASRPALVPEQEAVAWYERDRAFFEQHMGEIVLAQGQRMVSLDPWLVWGRGDMGSHDDAFFFNGRNGSGEPEYVTGHDPNTYPASEERRALEALIQAFPFDRPAIDLETARLTFEQMLDAFLSDGVLDAKEIASLCAMLVNLGICDDEIAAGEYVRVVAVERHPGVTFEET